MSHPTTRARVPQTTDRPPIARPPRGYLPVAARNVATRNTRDGALVRTPGAPLHNVDHSPSLRTRLEIASVLSVLFALAYIYWAASEFRPANGVGERESGDEMRSEEP